MSRWSKHSSRTLRTHRLAKALAFGAREARENDFLALRGKYRVKAGRKRERHDHGAQTAPPVLPLAASTPAAAAARVTQVAVGCMVQPAR
jgi:hypothetical protein